MNQKILVTYASKYGSTREIAEKIGDGLRQSGLVVDVLPVSSARDLSQYGAVILGSGVYIGSWHKEAAAFLQANEKALAERPVWIFSSGPTGEGDPVQLLEGWRLPPALQPVVDRIHPRDTAVFHGNINLNRLSLIEKWMIKMIKKPTGDFRDWKMISAWAGSVASALRAI